MKRRYPKVAGWLKKHVAKCKAEVDSLKYELECVQEQRSNLIDGLAQVETARVQAVKERDEARKAADGWKHLSAPADRVIESAKAKLATARDQAKYWEDAYSQSLKDGTKKVGEMRNEIDDLKAKLEKAHADKRNDAKYADARIAQLKTAYKSISGKVYEAWLSVSDVSDILEGED